MRSFISILGRAAGVVAASLLLLPSSLLAAGGGGGETIVFVADSRRYSGLLAIFANLYNESLAYFTLLTVVCVPLLALTLSFVMGFFLSKTGIDLKSRAVSGH